MLIYVTLYLILITIIIVKSFYKNFFKIKPFTVLKNPKFLLTSIQIESLPVLLNSGKISIISLYINLFFMCLISCTFIPIIIDNINTTALCMDSSSEESDAENVTYIDRDERLSDRNRMKAYIAILDNIESIFKITKSQYSYLYNILYPDVKILNFQQVCKGIFDNYNLMSTEHKKLLIELSTIHKNHDIICAEYTDFFNNLRLESFKIMDLHKYTYIKLYDQKPLPLQSLEGSWDSLDFSVIKKILNEPEYSIQIYKLINSFLGGEWNYCNFSIIKKFLNNNSNNLNKYPIEIYKLINDFLEENTSEKFILKNRKIFVLFNFWKNFFDRNLHELADFDPLTPVDTNTLPLLDNSSITEQLKSIENRLIESENGKGNMSHEKFVNRIDSALSNEQNPWLTGEDVNSVRSSKIALFKKIESDKSTLNTQKLLNLNKQKFDFTKIKISNTNDNSKRLKN